jgi:hypothetical protein
LSETGGVITPELALVDPELAEAQRQTTERKAAMSSTEPSNGTFFVDQNQVPPAAAGASPQPAPLAPVQAAPEPSAPTTGIPASTPMVDVPLGTLIFRAGLLAEEQLEDALQEGMRTGKRLGEVLLERGWLHERDLGRLLAGQKGLPFVEVRGSDAQPDALQLLPEDKARLQTALPLRHEDGELVVAVADPSNELVLENLRRTLGTEPRLVVAAQSELIRAIGEAYGAPPAVAPPPPAAASAPEPSAAPAMGAEPVQAPAPPPAPASAPAPAQEAVPVAAPAVPAPLPTVLPPPEERVVEPEVAPLQPLLPEPPAPAAEQQPAVVAPAPLVEESPAPALESPAPQPEPVIAADPAPLLQAAQPIAETPPVPGPLQPPVEPAESAPVVAPPAPEPEQHVAPPSPVEQPAEPSPAAEQPVEVPPAPPVEPVAPSATVTAEPEPTSTLAHSVQLRLRDGEVLEVGAFGTAAEAAAHAQEVVRQIAAAEGEATWPFFAERYLRPDTIVSVDLHAESAEKWLGSPVRSHWANDS